MFKYDNLHYLNQVKKFYFKNSRMPTYREMTALLEVTSIGAVAYCVKKWINEGIFSSEGKNLIPNNKFFALPLLGNIKAGVPSQEEEYFDTYSFKKLLFKNPDNTFALKVSGDSMIDEGIKDGDVVVLDKNKTPRVGDVVAAFIDEGWTLKYFMKENGKVYLKPANKKYKNIYPKQRLELGGVVINVIRSY